MNYRIATVAVFALVVSSLLSSCLATSQNSIWTSEDKNNYEILAGTWKVADSTVVFKPIPGTPDFWISSTSESDEDHTVSWSFGVIADIGTKPYLDLVELTPEEVGMMSKIDPAQVRSVIKGKGYHMFYKLYILEETNSVSIADVNDKWLHDYLVANPGALAHKPYEKDEQGNDMSAGITEITAGTYDLRKFINDHFTEGLFGAPITLMAVKGADPLGPEDPGIDIDK